MKISHIQLFWTIAIMELGMTLLMTITDSLQAAKQDAWISMALAGGISLLVAFISTRLALLYPEQTLVEASETILGSALGNWSSSSIWSSGIRSSRSYFANSRI